MKVIQNGRQSEPLFMGSLVTDQHQHDWHDSIECKLNRTSLSNLEDTGTGLGNIDYYKYNPCYANERNCIPICLYVMYVSKENPRGFAYVDLSWEYQFDTKRDRCNFLRNSDAQAHREKRPSWKCYVLSTYIVKKYIFNN